MQNFCGWFTPVPESTPAQTDMLTPLLATPGADPARTQLLHNANGVLAATGLNASLAQQDGVLALIVGRPRFSQGQQAHDTPAQTVLRLWRQYRQELPRYIHGNFALAVLEPHTQTTFLALDRVGIQTLAFASTPNAGLVFANRADVVAAHPDISAAIDPQGIFNYLYFFVVPAPGSIFQGVSKMLPGEWVCARAGVVTRAFYWHLNYRDAPRADFNAQAAHFKQLLRDGVARATGTDKVAAFLSGGTDSSTVAGILTEVQGKPARTYSIGFAADGFDEMEYARLAAHHFGLDAQEYYLTPDDVLTAIPLIAQQYDEPFANESAVAAYFCARCAQADGYDVMLGGDGGDEIFGGNERYAKQRIFEYYQAIPRLLRENLIEPITGLPGMAQFTPTRKLQSYVRQARIPLPARMETYNFIYRQPLTEMFHPEFLATINPGAPLLLLKDPYERAATTHFINQMLHLDIKFTLADNDLRKVTGMVEAAGMTVRYPLLDDALLDFSGEVPPNWKVKGHYLRWFFKTALRGYLPDAIIDKEKHGFGLPFGLWLREHTALRERMADRLADISRRGWLRPAYIEQMRHAHQTEHATYFGRMLWLLLTLEEWLEAHGQRG
ncbi:asparagine synthase [Chromatium okenii]|uniref:asparagine synthetase B family protein n=1 Tax=Chromatium okenii TaxID=61644 RepID=UPI001904E370|nr:asparagine synthase C-terminal domain-containing protein [Chromatium okenii]MBK1642625.1 asparagine synthase [Chromatium okenii]